MKSWQITDLDMRGLALRLCMLETHYRQPKDISPEALNQSAKTLRRWLSRIELSPHAPVPLPVLEALCDDLNTPQAIAEMHKLSKTDGAGLFAAMQLLGLIPGCGRREIDYDLVDGIKTIPIDQIPMVQWSASQ